MTEEDAIALGAIGGDVDVRDLCGNGARCVAGEPYFGGGVGVRVGAGIKWEWQKTQLVAANARWTPITSLAGHALAGSCTESTGRCGQSGVMTPAMGLAASSAG